MQKNHRELVRNLNLKLKDVFDVVETDTEFVIKMLDGSVIKDLKNKPVKVVEPPKEFVTKQLSGSITEISPNPVLAKKVEVVVKPIDPILISIITKYNLPITASDVFAWRDTGELYRIVTKAGKLYKINK